jgi:hypothetical protein
MFSLGFPVLNGRLKGLSIEIYRVQKQFRSIGIYMGMSRWVFFNIHRARKELILENYFNGDSTEKKLAFLSD